MQKASWPFPLLGAESHSLLCWAQCAAVACSTGLSLAANVDWLHRCYVCIGIVHTFAHFPPPRLAHNQLLCLEVLILPPNDRAVCFCLQHRCHCNTSRRLFCIQPTASGANTSSTSREKRRQVRKPGNTRRPGLECIGPEMVQQCVMKPEKKSSM